MYSQCNDTKLLECSSLAKDPDLMRFVQNQLKLTLLTATSDQFNKACNVVDRIINCVHNEARCEDTIPMVQIGLGQAKAFEYICKIDKEGYNKLVKCFSENKSMFDFCVNSPPTDCSSYIMLQKCLTESAKKNCGNSTTIDNFLYKSLQPTLDQSIGCKLVIPNTANAAERKLQPLFYFFMISFFIYNI